MKIFFSSMFLYIIFSPLSYGYVKSALCDFTYKEETKEITLNVGEVYDRM